MSDRTEMLRHALATLGYRAAGAVRDAPPGFGDFSAGADTRTPLEIVRHMGDLMRYTLSAVEGTPREEAEPGADFGAEVERFEDLVTRLSLALARAPLEADRLHERLLQGPVVDAITHVGQLSMLRRLAGSPVPGENFFAAPIRAPEPPSPRGPRAGAVVGEGAVSTIRAARSDDAATLQAIRHVAFAPVFASFRAILGPEIADVTQARDDAEQAELLASLMEPDSVWELYVAEAAGRLAGFVSVRLDRPTGVGEIGLNAVHPELAGQGIGTAMYRFALERMREEGLEVATVGTGGDPSHAPARRAYEKAGFTVGVPSVWLCRRLD